MAQSGETALVKASRNGHVDAAAALLQANADPNVPSKVPLPRSFLLLFSSLQTPLSPHLLAPRVAPTCHSNWAHEGSTHDPQKGKTPLNCAAENGHYAVVEYLLKANADPDATPKVVDASVVCPVLGEK